VAAKRKETEKIEKAKEIETEIEEAGRESVWGVFMCGGGRDESTEKVKKRNETEKATQTHTDEAAGYIFIFMYIQIQIHMYIYICIYIYIYTCIYI